MNNGQKMNDIDQYTFAHHISEQINNLILRSNRSSGYLARQEIDKLIDGFALNPKRLEQYGYKVYSQNDEDGILEEIFKRIGVEKGTFFEIGVENGLECNSLFLLHQGWRGVWIDGNESQSLPIQEKFAKVLKNQKLGLGIDFVTPSNINSLIRRHLSKIQIDEAKLDFLSIDVDGMDIYLFEALELTPKVICIEYNAKFPAHVSKKIVPNEKFTWNGTDYFGASLKAINEVAKEKGYSLVGTNITGANAFFVRDDLLGDQFANEEHLGNLYNPPRYYLTVDHFANSIGHRADFGDYVDLISSPIMAKLNKVIRLPTSISGLKDRLIASAQKDSL